MVLVIMLFPTYFITFIFAHTCFNLFDFFAKIKGKILKTTWLTLYMKIFCNFVRRFGNGDLEI